MTDTADLATARTDEHYPEQLLSVIDLMLYIYANLVYSKFI